MSWKGHRVSAFALGWGHCGPSGSTPVPRFRVCPQLFNCAPVICPHPSSKCPFVLFSLVLFEIGTQAIT